MSGSQRQPGDIINFSACRINPLCSDVALLASLYRPRGIAWTPRWGCLFQIQKILGLKGGQCDAQLAPNPTCSVAGKISQRTLNKEFLSAINKAGIKVELHRENLCTDRILSTLQRPVEFLCRSPLQVLFSDLRSLSPPLCSAEVYIYLLLSTALSLFGSAWMEISSLFLFGKHKWGRVGRAISSGKSTLLTFQFCECSPGTTSWRV